jgi:hypothetical protein
LANKKLDKISALDIEQVKMELKRGTKKRGKPYGPATINQQLVILQRLVNLVQK